MSKIFEVLSKGNLIKDESLSGSDPVPPVPVSEQASACDAQSAVTLPARPQSRVSLRVSALSPVFPFSDKNNEVAEEQYRILRTKILHHHRKPRMLMVSSACPGDGKTVSAVNIAASLSLNANASVLLVDADLRRPRVAELLGVPSQPGLADVLAGRVKLQDAIIQTKEFPALSILTAGEKIQNAAELLDSQLWRTTVEQMRASFTNIVLDTTPVGVVADYYLLQQISDAVIMIVRPDHTDRKACIESLRLIPKEKFLGVVLNCAERWLGWGAPDYYRHYAKDSSAM